MNVLLLYRACSKTGCFVTGKKYYSVNPLYRIYLSPHNVIDVLLTVSGRRRKFHPWDGRKAQRSASACEEKCNALQKFHAAS